MKKSWIITSLALCMSMSISAQTTQKLTATKASEYGIIYTLPSTVVDITIETEKTVKKPGEFYRYAKKYFNANDAIDRESESITLKSITLTTRGIADSKQQYLMQFKSGSTPYLILNEENLPLAINTTEIPEAEEIDLPEAQAAAPTALETKAAQQVISKEMAQSQSSAKRAELAANQLFELRQTRQDILNGQAEQMPADGESMQITLSNIQAQEDALIAMFMGTTQVSTSVKTITFTPSDEVTREIIARISASEGIIDADDLAGEPIYLTLNIVEEGKLPLTEKGEPKKFPKGGVAYNIPGKVSLKIEYSGKTFCDAIIPSAQHGVVFGIDPKLFTDKKAPAYLLFEPTTGAIKELGAINLEKK